MNASPNARLPFDPDCRIPAFVLGGLAIFGFALALAWLWIPALIALGVVLAFFRDPPRRIPAEPGAVVSPADGKIDMIHTNEDPEAGPVGGPVVTIFLSVLDVHINRAPCACTVESVRYRPGQFLNALDPASTDHNEASIIGLDCGGYKMVVMQIAGIIARRIVCRVQPGDRLARGQRLGLIRFGSRTQIYLPAGSRVVVQVGDRVAGARDIVAWLPEPAAAAPAPEPPAAAEE